LGLGVAGGQLLCGRIPVGNAAAANNNGRDLLEMGIYPDRLLQVHGICFRDNRS
jgi:hypothetical protein